MNIVIVGHVDHGKSTLIGRLFFDTDSLPEGKMEEIKTTCEQLGREVEFAYVMDNLREEREQGITIDTATTFFKTDKRQYVIIDAPGHVEFIKNMITGASHAEAAILIVDGSEGVQEQTRRHAYILGMLDLKQVIVVINKLDQEKYDEGRFKQVKEDTLEFLKSINITPTYVIPISAKEGDNIAKDSDNMEWYDGLTVLSALDTFKNKPMPVDKPLRYPVQDVYVQDGKRIFAGRVESGKVREGEEVTVLPDPRKTKVKTVEFYMKDLKEAEAGMSVGVTTEDKLFIERGNVICTGDLPKVSNQLKARVFWMSKQPMGEDEKMVVKLATQEAECTLDVVKRINSSTLEELGKGPLGNNEVAEAVIKVEEPFVVESFNDIPELGRLVLVRGFDVVAGGIIT